MYPEPPITPQPLQDQDWTPNPVRWLVAVGLLILLLVVVAATARLARREYRTQLGIRHSETAMTLLESGEVDRATVFMRSALQLTPLRADVQRRAAHFFSSLGNANAFIFWHNLFLLEPPHGEDVMAFMDWCRRVGREELIPGLLPESDSAEVQLARALTTTNVFERVTVLDRLAANPSPVVRFETALQGCVSTNVAWVRVGRQRMLQLAAEPFATAQMFLLVQPSAEAVVAAQSLEQIKQDPWVPEWRPMADFVLRNLPLPDPIREQARTNLAIAMFLHRQHQSLLRPDWLHSSLTNYPLFLLQAEQLADQGQWKELLSHCEQTNRMMLPEMRKAIAMLCQHRQGIQDEAFRNQTEALRVASGHPARLLNLLQFSRANGFVELNASILREFCQMPGWRAKASTLLFQLGTSERRLVWMVEGAEYLADGDVTSPWYGAWVYGRALFEKDLAGLRLPVGNSPDQLIARALLLARQGDAIRAIDAIEAIPEGFRNTHWRVAAAFVYRQANQRARSVELIRRINLDECFDEERYLLGLDLPPAHDSPFVQERRVDHPSTP